MTSDFFYLSDTIFNSNHATLVGTTEFHRGGENVLNHGYERRNKYRKTKWETETKPEKAPVTKQRIVSKPKSIPQPHPIENPQPVNYDGTQTIHQFTTHVNDVINEEVKEPVVSNENVEGVSYLDVEHYANRLAHIFGKFAYIYELIFLSLFVAMLFVGAFAVGFSSFVFEHPSVLNVYVVTALILVMLVISTGMFNILIAIYKSILRCHSQRTDRPYDGKIESKSMQKQLLHINVSLLIWSGLAILLTLLVYALQQNMVVASPVATSTALTFIFTSGGVGLSLALIVAINLHIIKQIQRRK